MAISIPNMREFRVYASAQKILFSFLGSAALLLAFVAIVGVIVSPSINHTLIALAFFGTFLVIMGSLLAYANRTWAYGLKLVEGDQLRCTSLAGTREIPLKDIKRVEVVRDSEDGNLEDYGFIAGATQNFRTYAFNPKRTGDFVDFALELKRVNPEIKLLY